MTTRVALVTGSATGLGVMVNQALAQAGFAVAVNYVHSEGAARHQVASLRALGVQAKAYQANVADAAAVDAMFDALEQDFGRLDVLVNCAGPFNFQRKLLGDHSLEEWHELVDGNLSSAFYCIRRALPLMRRNRFGRIINFGFAEAAGAPGWAGRAAYGAAKVALVSLTRAVAIEEARYGITCNLICPGDIRPPFKEQGIEMARGVPDPNTPLGRPGTGGDIARAIRFLCEDDSDFITGSIIEVTGGREVLVPWARIQEAAQPEVE